MCVIGHAVDRNQFLAFPRDNSGDVFLQFFSARGCNDARPTGDGEDNVQIYLRVGIGHLAQPHMALLTELITSTFVTAINMSRLWRYRR
jgi:hypothetical protein